MPDSFLTVRGRIEYYMGLQPKLRANVQADPHPRPYCSERITDELPNSSCRLPKKARFGMRFTLEHVLKKWLPGIFAVKDMKSFFLYIVVPVAGLTVSKRSNFRFSLVTSSADSILLTGCQF